MELKDDWTKIFAKQQVTTKTKELNKCQQGASPQTFDFKKLNKDNIFFQPKEAIEQLMGRPLYTPPKIDVSSSQANNSKQTNSVPDNTNAVNFANFKLLNTPPGLANDISTKKNTNNESISNNGGNIGILPIQQNNTNLDSLQKFMQMIKTQEQSKSINQTNNEKIPPKQDTLEKVNLEQDLSEKLKRIMNVDGYSNSPSKNILNSPNSNVDKTKQLTSFLNCLGFQIGNQLEDTKKKHSIYREGPIELVIRAKEGVYFVDEDSKDYLKNPQKLVFENATVSQFSDDGDYLAIADPKKIVLMEMINRNNRIINKANVLALQFSPKGSFLISAEQRDKDKCYILVYKISTLEQVYEFEINRFKKENWPYLKFTEDDKLVFRMKKSNSIEVMDTDKQFTRIDLIETGINIDFFVISPKKENILVVCIACEKIVGYSNTSGALEVYKYPNHDQKPLISTILNKAQEVEILFSPTGQHLLLWTQTTHDETGKSYYGQHCLIYIDVVSNNLKLVPLYKGPIHDVAWSPNGEGFVVISGFMPAGSVLFDNTCNPKFEFGRHHRNTIKWSPLSRFLCLAGFGNLSGDMDIWDITTLTQIGTCKSNAAVFCSWSPDGRKILTAVLNPRLRVDNGYKIFKYNGTLMVSADFSQTELYNVSWRPGKYPDRPASPDLMNQFKKDETEDLKPKKIFQPKGSTGTFAAMLKAAKKTSGSRYLNPDERFDNDYESPKPKERREKNRHFKKNSNTKDKEREREKENEKEKPNIGNK